MNLLSYIILTIIIACIIASFIIIHKSKNHGCSCCNKTNCPFKKYEESKR